MKKKTLITLRIIITLILISPILGLAYEEFYPRFKTAPPQNLVGAWESEFETLFGESHISFNLYEDGTVEGMVGNAVMQNAYLRIARGWFFKLLSRHWETDYMIMGRLKGSVIDDVQCATFWMEGDFDENGINVGVVCWGCHKGDKEGKLGPESLSFRRAK
jgi:hypothetical protein